MKHIKQFETYTQKMKIGEYIIYTTLMHNQISKDKSENLILAEVLSIDPVKVIRMEIETENPERIFGDRVTYSNPNMLNIIYSSNSLEDAKEEFEKLKQIYMTKWEIKKNSNKFNL